MYGTDNDFSSDDEGVHIPENSLRLTNEHFDLLQSTVSWNSSSQYKQAVDVIEHIVLKIFMHKLRVASHLEIKFMVHVL